MALDKITIPESLKEEFWQAKQELGKANFASHLRMVDDKPVLDFVKTIVINLPGSCYSNCSYCIDACLRKHTIQEGKFLQICEKTFQTFPNPTEITITGGTLDAKHFNKLLGLIDKYYSCIKITWNTNGALVDDKYNVEPIRYINLHRNAADDVVNQTIFRTTKPLLSIEKAKKLFGNKLHLRVTIDANFNIKDYAPYQLPLYLNRMLPITDATDRAFKQTLQVLQTEQQYIDRRRRNNYLNYYFQNIPVRICLGDPVAKRVSGRHPTYLNVVIVHRSGKVCGSWYEDDKLLF